MRFEELKVGQTAELSKSVSDSDIVRFAEITGDYNPVHLDEAAATRSMFKGRIAHGMLTAGLISAALAQKLPGAGCVYLSQALKFKAPVRIGDTITTRLEVMELNPEKRRVTLSTTCRNQNDETVLVGEAVVLVPEDLNG